MPRCASISIGFVAVMAAAVGEAGAQVVSGPIPPGAAASAAPASADARPIDQGVEDVTALQVSLHRAPSTLRQDNNFEHVYRAGDGRFYRRAGATVAFFGGSEYAIYRGQLLPLIPAGTVFHPCGFPDGYCGNDLQRHLAGAMRAGASCGPCDAGNALSGGYRRGELLGPRERHDLRCVGSSPIAAPASEFATRRATQRIESQPLRQFATLPAAAIERRAPAPQGAPNAAKAPPAPLATRPPSGVDLLTPGAEEAARQDRLARLAREAIESLRESERAGK